MNKISCNVCKDLLPVYIDRLCSEESEQLVENHMADCDDCRNTYEAMREDVDVPKIEKEEKDKTDEFKLNLNKKWHRFVTTRAIVISSISIVSLSAIILGIYFLFFHYYYVSGDKVTFTAPCELEDGRIAFRLSDSEGKKGFNNVKILSYEDVEYGEQNALYVVAESTIFDKSDEPNYIDYDLYNYENNESYDKIIYGLPSDKNRKCIWTDESLVSFAEGDVAKHFYENIDSLSKLSSDGDVWTCDDLNLEITYHTGFQQYDTTISQPIITAKIKDYNYMHRVIDDFFDQSVYDKKNKDQRDAEFVVYDDQINHQLELRRLVNGKVLDNSEKDIYINYSIEDENKIIITSYDEMEYMMFSSIGTREVSYPLNKSSKKSKLTDFAKLELINTFCLSVGEQCGFSSKDIKDFKYNKSDSDANIACKIEISDVQKIENYLESYECEENDLNNVKAELFGFDKKNVVKSYVMTDFCDLSDMYENEYGEYDIVKEGEKYYFYVYLNNRKKTQEEVIKYYEEMENLN